METLEREMIVIQSKGIGILFGYFKELWHSLTAKWAQWIAKDHDFMFCILITKYEMLFVIKTLIHIQHDFRFCASICFNVH